MIRYVAVPALLGLLVAPACGQSAEAAIRSSLNQLSGTISSYHDPLISAGQITGCTFVFEHLASDSKYMGGDFIRSSGSVGLMSGGGDAIALVVKVLAKRVRPDPALSPETFPLGRAYLLGAQNNSNFPALIEAQEAEQAGGVFAIYHLDQSAPLLFEIMETGKITVAVAPPGGGMDILLPIDFTVTATNDDGSRQTSEAALLEFGSCLGGMVD